jgi:hypothetical protein
MSLSRLRDVSETSQTRGGQAHPPRGKGPASWHCKGPAGKASLEDGSHGPWVHMRRDEVPETVLSMLSKRCAPECLCGDGHHDGGHAEVRMSAVRHMQANRLQRLPAAST